MITKLSFNNNQYHWLIINSEDNDILNKLYEDYAIDKTIIRYALDKDERAHLKYDPITSTFVLVYNVPNHLKIDDHYETIPMVFLIREDTLITITNKHNQYLIEDMKKYLDNNNTITIFQFLFSSLFIITDTFFPLVEEMDDDRKIINSRLKKKTTKRNLLSLSDLETGIVYFLSASKQNVLLLEQIQAHTDYYKAFTTAEKKQFEDVLIEAKQVVEMTQISSQILKQHSVAYNNVLNNNINDTMKLLTALSIILTVPTIVSGFFGMNMPLPLEDNPMGWFITIIMCIVSGGILAIILKRLMK